MKLSEFPEKLFEIVYNHEIIAEKAKRHQGITLWSPSQNQEASLGCDAMFNDAKRRRIIAIQYKIPTWRYKRGKYKNYLKFNLYKKNGIYKQHQAMLDLINNHIANMVYYCVPTFTSLSKLNKYVEESKLKNNSKLIVPSVLVGSGNHYCVYKNGKKSCFLCDTESNAEEELFDDVFFCKNNIDDFLVNKGEFIKFINEHKDELVGVLFYAI